jgi:exodeoxyribonuclease VII small subunit
MGEGDSRQAVTFEEALAGLESVVARLESGDVGLEEAVALFEEGRRHLAVCRERLAVAQGRIEELTASDLPAGGITAEEPF